MGLGGGGVSRREAPVEIGPIVSLLTIGPVSPSPPFQTPPPSASPFNERDHSAAHSMLTDVLPMNAIFFGCKRAFHGCLRVARQLLSGFDLTPARFDMLTAVGQDKNEGCTQRELRTRLGVSAATISRMLRSLEELGLVSGQRHEQGDRRTRWLKLTSKGLSCIRRATRRIVNSGAAQFAVDSALTKGHFDESPCLQEMDRAETIFDLLRQGFGDFATLYYSWNPDD